MKSYPPTLRQQPKGKHRTWERPQLSRIQNVETVPPRFTEPTNGNVPSLLRRNKLLILVFVLGLCLLVAVIGLAIGLSVRPKNASTEDRLHGYKRVPGYEVYRPKPSFVLDKTDLQQCMKNALTNNDTEPADFQFCAPKGVQQGRCDLFSNNTRSLTRLDEDCEIYTRGDPADLGLPHGGAAKTGILGDPVCIIASAVLFMLTYWRWTVDVPAAST
ncbi:hypothetical protein MTO96_008813 [Rhipicephalus appendiculatus]